MPTRSATGWLEWKYARQIPAKAGVPATPDFAAPPPFAAGERVLVTFTETRPSRRVGQLVIITESAAVVISCQPGVVPTVRVRFTAGGLAGSTAGVPVSRVRKDPGVRR